MKKNLNIFFLIIIGTGIAVLAYANGNYLTEIEDLPLPLGLSEQPGGLMFDTVDGQIIEATAKGKIDRQQIQSFYNDTLPQLGWEKTGDLAFRRDHEILRVTVDEKHHLVRFSLAPE